MSYNFAYNVCGCALQYSHYMNAVDRLKEDGYTLVATCLDDDAGKLKGSKSGLYFI